MRNLFYQTTDQCFNGMQLQFLWNNNLQMYN